MSSDVYYNYIIVTIVQMFAVDCILLNAKTARDSILIVFILHLLINS